MWYVVTEERKQFDHTTMDLHDCLVAVAALEAVQAQYAHHAIPEPSWLHGRLTMFERRIRDLNLDRQAHALAQINGQLALLQAPDEKRAELLKQKAALEAVVPPAAARP
jgi:hypothetical protein